MKMEETATRPEEMLELDEQPTESESPMDAQAAILQLQQEVARLQKALAQKEQEQKAYSEEWQAFAGLYPQVTAQSIPKSVWEQVEQGVPLRAAYALYEKQEGMQQAVNLRNAERSTGAVGGIVDSGYYSPEEVRRMSEKEVRQKYGLILESMKKWN